jgi:hypothetical protein
VCVNIRCSNYEYFGSSFSILEHDEQVHQNIHELQRWKCVELESDGGAIAQAVSRRVLTAAARFRFQFRSCGICGGQNSTGAGFLRALRFPLPILIPPTINQSTPTLYILDNDSVRRKLRVITIHRETEVPTYFKFMYKIKNKTEVDSRV